MLSIWFDLVCLWTGRIWFGLAGLFLLTIVACYAIDWILLRLRLVGQFLDFVRRKVARDAFKRRPRR